MSSVRLYYLLLDEADSATYEIDKPIAQELESQWMAELPAEKQASLQRLIDQRNRDVSLIAQRLLKHSVADEGIEEFQLKDICYASTAKPYWPGKNKKFLDFNISHSGRVIIVAASQEVDLGVDVEKNRPLKNLSFKMVLSDDELEMIKKTPEVFFDLWSKKEAVVKAADTTGIARMRDVVLQQESAELDGKIWHIKSIDKTLIDIEFERETYSIYLATSAPVEKLIIKQMFLDEL